MRVTYRGLVDFYHSQVTQPRLRVLFVTSMWPDETMPYYGPFIRSQAVSLEAAGAAIDVVAIRGYKSLTAYGIAGPVVARLARREGYDLTHIHSGHAAAIALLGAPKPTVVSFVGGDLLGHHHERGITTKSRIEVMAFRQLARRADATITKSKAMARALPRAVHARNSVIPNGVDVHAFAPQPKAEARRALGWPTNERVVLFLGNPDDPLKNIGLARAAVRHAAQAVPSLRLRSAWRVPPERIPQLMWAADCLALSSRSEGSPNVVKEAMAAALPVVATPVGDVAEHLAGIPGCFVARPDTAEFGRALQAAVMHGPTPAARTAVMRLSLENVASRIITVYQRVILSTHRSR
jgi:glycosyltransferase involved in cell wall biosynthesis